MDGNASKPHIRHPGSAGIERGIALTDAVVAIAMTLLVLPLVELSGDVDPDRLGDFFAQNWDIFLSFVISFLVIYVFWAAHAAGVRPLRDQDSEVRGLSALTMVWLLVIAFLPFPTAIVGRDLTTATATLYIGTMLALAVLTSGISTLVARATGSGAHVPWGWATAGLLALSTLVSTFNAALGMYSLLLLIPLRIVEARAHARSAR